MNAWQTALQPQVRVCVVLTALLEARGMDVICGKISYPGFECQTDSPECGTNPSHGPPTTSLAPGVRRMLQPEAKSLLLRTLAVIESSEPELLKPSPRALRQSVILQATLASIPQAMTKRRHPSPFHLARYEDAGKG